MQYDPDLAERLAALPTIEVDQFVFRTTRRGVDATAPSVNGGRWGRPMNDEAGTAVLHTSLARDGAIAEVVAMLMSLSPVPSKVLLKVSRLSVSCSRAVRLAKADLAGLGVDMGRYGSRDYARTQEIGSTLAWLGVDGLIAPSARWDCENLMLFTDNHTANERLDFVEDEAIDWLAWAKEHGRDGPAVRS